MDYRTEGLEKNVLEKNYSRQLLMPNQGHPTPLKPLNITAVYGTARGMKRGSELGTHYTESDLFSSTAAVTLGEGLGVAQTMEFRSQGLTSPGPN